MDETFNDPAYAEVERPFTSTVWTVEGGDRPSNVRLVCRSICRLSYPHGACVRKVQDLVEAHICAAVADDPWLWSHAPRIDYPRLLAVGWAQDPGAPLARRLTDSHRRMTGKELEMTVFEGTADARYSDRSQGEQEVYYGPLGVNGHMPDEYAQLDSIITGSKVLARFTVDWCG